jgi:hypothetical protein
MSSCAVHNAENTDIEHNDEENVSSKRQHAKKLKRKVSFFGRVRVLKISDQSILTDELRSSLWYTSEELVESSEAVERTIELMMNNVTISAEDERHCPDGLYTPDEQDDRRRTILTALDKVLLEQNLQLEDEIDNPDFVADIYYECSYHSQRLAMERGFQHAKAVAELNQPSFKKLTSGLSTLRRPRAALIFQPAHCFGVAQLSRTNMKATKTSFLEAALDVLENADAPRPIFIV